jgi:hypothetical protein
MAGQQRVRDENVPDRSQPGDAGKTSGGGSSGHDQPDDVNEQTEIRNQNRSTGRTGAQRDTPDPIPELEP